MNKDYNYLKSLLLKELKNDEQRYKHSIEVANRAIDLAKLHGIFDKRIYISALFHDVCKNYTKNDYIKLIGKYYYNKYARDAIFIHGYAASIFLKNKLNIKCNDYINAVRYHSYSRKKASLIEKIIFISDKTDATRVYKNVEEIRKMSNINLDKSILLYINDFKLLLKQKNRKMNKNTLKLEKKLLREEK